MAPSLSAVERGNPPPRRKSCAACIKAKRRCDLRQPSCLRCSQRKIDCSYPIHVENPSRKRSDTTPSSTEVSPNARPQELMKDPLPEMACWDTGFDFNMDMGAAYTPACTSFPTLSFDEPTIPGLEFLNDVVNLDSTLSPISPTPSPLLDLEEPMPIVVRPPVSVSQIAGLTRIQLLRAASELIEKRLRYSVGAFKRAPESMLLEGGTPWSHPALYRDSMPTCLEDALGACALYRAKNSTNTAMIQRVIELRYQKLLTAPAPTTNPSEMMARSHALILYQIMLFFDDSLPARTLAEETVSALGESAMALMEFARHEEEDDDDSVSNPSRNIPLYPLTAARALYSDWTFQESLRRTLLILFLFTQLQCLMRADFSSFMSSAYAPPSVPLTTPSCVDPSTLAAIKHALQQSPYNDDSTCDARLLMCRSLTLSAHLWNSRDPVEFAVAWRDKKHLVAQPSNIWKRIDAAQPDDIDQFGRMLMTSGMGIEEAKGWFAAKGGRL